MTRRRFDKVYICFFDISGHFSEVILNLYIFGTESGGKMFNLTIPLVPFQSALFNDISKPE